MVSKVSKQIILFSKIVKNLTDSYLLSLKEIYSLRMNSRESNTFSIDFLSLEIQRIVAFYVKYFCDMEEIRNNSTYRSVIKKIINDARDVLWIPILKKYASILKIRPEKSQRKRNKND